ncbi:OadG family transporter subunit [Novipirellula artificiosorum]|uniref:Oxaloacetate decarboxylase, gamma chain n=1 Tax=Novipirellula artificiosorum TaxID=2528016 RepID=A0A5C6DIP1_9BACT|nr:OadG family transporter subunit [Novipirellula artificiosorum]TWU37243.1 Oxaloacetate decarboxylase, gamma chain [Novipirellula artificiosorum]
MLLSLQTAVVPLFTINTEALFEETGLPLAIMGMFVVFSALLILIFCVSMLPRAMVLLDKFMPATPHHGAAKPKPKPKKKEAKAAKAVADVGGVSEEIAVVIAAAVAQVMDQPHRIVRTRQLTAAELAWTLQGRIRHHASHKLKPQGR